MKEVEIDMSKSPQTDNKVIALHANPDDIKVFITKDPQLLQAYYDMRHNAYKQENGWVGYSGVENEFDRHGHIVVATDKKTGEVLGGIRLMFSDQYRNLSNEIPGTQFEYKQVLKRFNKIGANEDVLLSEFSALVVNPRYRDNTITDLFFRVMLGESEKYGCDYFFAVAPAISCRSYRMGFHRLDYDFEIVINHPWKEKKVYNFDPMFPMYAENKHRKIAS